MKRLLSAICLLVIAQSAIGQITITASDMPVSGDTLRYSFTNPVGSTIDLADTGGSKVWNYAFTPLRQAVDTYKTALQVSPLYLLTIGYTAYGYKVADSFPGAPLPIRQLYTFFEKKTSPRNCYQAQAFGANISGVPTPANYSKADVWYYFPLTYNNNDSGNYALNFSLSGLGGIKQVGYRKSRVDAWGTITTPYFTTPVACIRVRQEIHEIDSFTFGTTTFGFPRNSVEYKWLVNGQHYPALWVTTNMFGPTETIATIRYRDSYRDLTPPDTTTVSGVAAVSDIITDIKAIPNPSDNGKVTLDLPTAWQEYIVEIFDVQSRVVAACRNERRLDLSSLPKGQYVARVIAGEKVAYIRIER